MTTAAGGRWSAVTYEPRLIGCDRVGDYRVAWVFFLSSHAVGFDAIYEDTNTKACSDFASGSTPADMRVCPIPLDFVWGAPSCTRRLIVLDRNNYPRRICVRA